MGDIRRCTRRPFLSAEPNTDRSSLDLLLKTPKIGPMSFRRPSSEASIVLPQLVGSNLSVIVVVIAVIVVVDCDSTDSSSYAHPKATAQTMISALMKISGTVVLSLALSQRTLLPA